MIPLSRLGKHGPRRLVAALRRQRLCPDCGQDVRKGFMTCPFCFYSFAGEAPEEEPVLLVPQTPLRRVRL
jgi:hypothetical protein